MVHMFFLCFARLTIVTSWIDGWRGYDGMGDGFWFSVFLVRVDLGMI